MLPPLLLLVPTPPAARTPRTAPLIPAMTPALILAIAQALILMTHQGRLLIETPISMVPR